MRCAAFTLLCLFLAGFCLAQEEFPNLRVGVLLDGRFVNADKTMSWLDGGLGKLRFGSENGDRANFFRLAQASLLVNADFTDSFSAKAQLNVDPEPDRGFDRRRIDIIEGFISYHPILSTHTRIKARGGLFFPPVSLENTGPAWTTPYTITTSAINSWIGEEVRATGGEFTFVWSGAVNEFALTAAAFRNNDPTGSLLAWRGWALQDRQTGYKDKLPLAPIPSIGPDGVVFRRQPFYVEPFREVDGRIGCYGGAAWNNSNSADARILYFDNRGNPIEFDGKQYGWHTRFANAGIHLTLPAHFEILAQYLKGTSRMGPGNRVDVEFYGAYLLASVPLGKSRISVRYDDFYVENRDRFHDLDNNDEDGSAWTAAYLFHFSDHFRLAFEWLRVDSTRPFRTTIGEPAHAAETQFQTSFRLLF